MSIILLSLAEESNRREGEERHLTIEGGEAFGSRDFVILGQCQRSVQIKGSSNLSFFHCRDVTGDNKLYREEKHQAI